ncbi:hypothetical protein NDU88_000206 [Pleurodeles waltl]|uniref:Uncharacterized protein n=1 Tax=Pleurodeles waltl TaxID=8319 RepID=A0AAV7S742_PLEWA|nr:hypothetical protein NDU88_000206 [Pleurodeles waltl]
MGGRGQGPGDGARLNFLLRRGRRENVQKRAFSGPIGVRAEGLSRRRVLGGGIGPSARSRTGGLGARPKPRPCVVLGATRHGARADGPKTAGDSGRVSPRLRGCRWGPGGPNEDAPSRGAARQRIWTRAAL